MTTRCTTPDELGKAIKNNEDTIIIGMELGDMVIKIMATGKVAWGVCAASLAVAIALCLATPAVTVVAPPVGGGMALAGGITVATAAVATIGPAVAITAIAIGVAAGGIGALNTLRDKYEIVEKDEKHIKLQRKNKKERRQWDYKRLWSYLKR